MAPCGERGVPPAAAVLPSMRTRSRAPDACAAALPVSCAVRSLLHSGRCRPWPIPAWHGACALSSALRARGGALASPAMLAAARLWLGLCCRAASPWPAGLAAASALATAARARVGDSAPPGGSVKSTVAAQVASGAASTSHSSRMLRTERGAGSAQGWVGACASAAPFGVRCRVRSGLLMPAGCNACTAAGASRAWRRLDEQACHVCAAASAAAPVHRAAPQRSNVECRGPLAHIRATMRL